jgi:recombination endonuclease VII
MSVSAPIAPNQHIAKEGRHVDTSIQSAFEFREIISKADARALGRKRFFDGISCKAGHVSERHVASGQCIECSNRRRILWGQVNPEKHRAINLRNKKKYAKEYAAQEAQYRADFRPKVLAHQAATQARWTARNPEHGKLWRRAKRVAMAGRPRPEHCEACGAKAKKICYDHCHVTNRFRGWLCSNCNCALGHVNDSEERLMKLIEYVRRGMIRDH